MSQLELVKLLIDFGLVVLIWMVQLIIYPSFLHYDSHKLATWHPIYTIRITMIVAPLMVIQLALSAYLLISNYLYVIYEIVDIVLIAVNWHLTMFVFIKLHEKINADPTDRSVQKRLVTYNWIRVLLFCTVFINYFIYYLKM